MSSQMTHAGLVRELHHDLRRKYDIHGAKIEDLWKRFTKDQRTEAIRNGAVDGRVLEHRDDESLGNVSSFIPEWNLRDLTDPDTTLLTDLVRYRATATLIEQYSQGHLMNHPHGDYGHIIEMQRTKGIRFANEASVRGCYTFFLHDADQYGLSLAIHPGHDAALEEVHKAIEAGVCVPQATGELILIRQVHLLQALNIVIEDILEIGGSAITKIVRPPDRRAKISEVDALKQEAQRRGRPDKHILANVIATAKEQIASIHDYEHLLYSEPTLLSHIVNIAFFSRPELVPDEKGRSLPVHTDRYISAAFFEAVNRVLKTAATWGYIYRLLQLLHEATDRAHQIVILQELCNTCWLQYEYSRDFLKRQVQTGIGARCFKRISTANPNGNARVAMKTSPKELTRADPQLHYLLRLCQAETDSRTAFGWIEKLESLYNLYPSERERLSEREFESYCDHTVVVSFVNSLGTAVSLPNVSRKHGQRFVSDITATQHELGQVRDNLDLYEFAVPIDNLRQPAMASGALLALNQAVVSKTRTQLQQLYVNLTERCSQGLEDHLRQIKNHTKEAAEHANQARYSSITSSTERTGEASTKQRRRKEKTRPANSLEYEATTMTSAKHVEAREEKQPQPLKVNSSAMSVFRDLFISSEARGSVSWEKFKAAMEAVGFSATPRFGSVYTFSPSDDLGLEQSLTLHRPHKSKIKPWLSVIIARRLKRKYGWSLDSFTAD